MVLSELSRGAFNATSYTGVGSMELLKQFARLALGAILSLGLSNNSHAISGISAGIGSISYDIQGAVQESGTNSQLITLKWHQYLSNVTALGVGFSRAEEPAVSRARYLNFFAGLKSFFLKVLLPFTIHQLSF